MSGLIHCQHCNYEHAETAKLCPGCGAPNTTTYSEKSFLTSIILTLFLGAFGAHRLYLGHKKSGFLMLVIMLGSIIGYFIAIASIVTSNNDDTSIPDMSLLLTLIMPMIGFLLMSIWAMVDLVLILVGKMKDGHNKALSK